MELKCNIRSEEEEQPTRVADINQSILIRGTVDNTENNLPSSSHGPAIQWAEGTVDNEFMGKKKSNCCCIYEKPKRWDETSSSSSFDSDPTSDNDNMTNKDKQSTHKQHTQCTEHCRGHTRRCYRKKKKSDDPTQNVNSENFNKLTETPIDSNTNSLCL
ncbi:hypothetical protein EWB00_006672 [Schistosoma japonicum]|uniref:E3 ubiquitin-protein ligase PPP1R11 n=1 Tax=Schistosoma japonicum TaxID=6182 RepID=A0A4Z2CXW2_SCHJA|nr:hypothetical protein EWB00_006672 [Schistosoma japonicum]